MHFILLRLADSRGGMRSARRWKTREGPERQLGSSVTPGTPSGGRRFSLPLSLLIMTVLPAGDETGQTAGRLTAAQLCHKQPKKACALLYLPRRWVWNSKKCPIIFKGFRSAAHLSSGAGVLFEQVCRFHKICGWQTVKTEKIITKYHLIIKPCHTQDDLYI